MKYRLIFDSAEPYYKYKLEQWTDNGVTGYWITRATYPTRGDAEVNFRFLKKNPYEILDTLDTEQIDHANPRKPAQVQDGSISLSSDSVDKYGLQQRKEPPLPG